MALTALALPGCMSLNCTSEARFSVAVTAVDEAGAPVVIDRIVYTVDGGDPIEVDCPSSLGEGYCLENSNEASIGVERQGTFVITVHQGNATGSTEVFVPGADCDHVDPQAVTIVVEAAP